MTHWPSDASSGAPASSDPPSGPGEMPKFSWWAALKRTFREFREDNLTDLAAGLTYYGLLALFPAVLVLVSLLGLAGPGATRTLTETVDAVLPADVAGVVTSAIQNLQGNPAAAGIFGLVGLLVALWSASGYIAAFMRASNIVYDVPEGRPVWKTLPVRVGVTLLLVVLLTFTVLAVAATGVVAQGIGQALGLGPVVATVWDIAKWPVLLVIVVFMIALLYWASPNARRGFRWVSPGSVLAVTVWLAASALFAVYVANFAGYGRTYGSMAALVIFLVWLWITNIAILLGEEFNAEIERGRAAEAGHPVGEEPYVELRDLPREQRPDKRGKRIPRQERRGVRERWERRSV